MLELDMETSWYWLAIHKGDHDESSLRALEAVLPFLGRRARPLLPGDGAEAALFASLAHMAREQLALANDPDASWCSPRPPYIGGHDIVLDFTSVAVCPTPVLPPFSVFNERRRPDGLPCTIDGCCLELQNTVITLDLKPRLFLDALVAKVPKEMHVDGFSQILRLLGGRVMRICALGKALHWQTRQTFEAYLGHVVLSHLLFTNLQLDAVQTLRAAGLVFSNDGAPHPFTGPQEWETHILDNTDPSVLDLTQWGITDRWGKLRSIDRKARYLVSLPCQTRNCSLRLRFHMCGCACQYYHARSTELGLWLRDAARWKLDHIWKPQPQEELLKAVPIPGKMKNWHAAIHWKTVSGTMSFNSLPYIEPQALNPLPYYALPAVREYCEGHGIERMDDEAVFISEETVHLHPVQPEEREQVFELLKRIKE